MDIPQHVGVSPPGDDLISSGICGVSHERWGVSRRVRRVDPDPDPDPIGSGSKKDGPDGL
jgi:hypothetical protein